MNAESGAELLGRLRASGFREKIAVPVFIDSLSPGNVYEIAGLSGSGKSQFLFTVVAHSIMPKCCGGLETSVILVDCDLKLSEYRLLNLLETRLAAVSGQLNAQPKPKLSSVPFNSEIILDCLSRLHLVRCTSAEQLLHMFDHLDDFLMKVPGVSGLCIDGISTFSNDFDSSRAANVEQDKFIARLKQFTIEHQLSALCTCRQMLKINQQPQSDASDSDGKMNRQQNVDETPPQKFDTMGRFWRQTVKETFELEMIESNDQKTVAVVTLKGADCEAQSLVITDAGADCVRK